MAASTVLPRDTPARLCRLTQSRCAPTSGRCCVEGCGADAVHWIRSTTSAGVRAVLACRAHELVAERLLYGLGLGEAVRLATPAQRRRALRLAEDAAASAVAHSRASADLQGASSVTHTHTLVAGYYESVALAERAFAAAVLELHQACTTNVPLY